jgi:hypothetical protein
MDSTIVREPLPKMVGLVPDPVTIAGGMHPKNGLMVPHTGRRGGCKGTKLRLNLGQNSHILLLLLFFKFWGLQDFFLDAKRFVHVFLDQSLEGLG